MQNRNHIACLTENPLDRIAEPLGLCGIFRTIACIGDSLSSGEFEVQDQQEPPQKKYLDLFEYSWGQHIARRTGSRVYNFSRGGMSAKWYLDSFGDENDLWNPEKAAQAYIIALGVNDLFGAKQPVGSVEDIHVGEPEKNADTFAGYYAQIIERYRAISPNARFFLMTMPRENNAEDSIRAAHAELLHRIAALYPHTFVLDFYRYAPVYDAEFKKKFFMYGHMNPAGYVLTARMTEAYLDHLILQYPDEFDQVGLIGTPDYDTRLDKV